MEQQQLMGPSGAKGRQAEAKKYYSLRREGRKGASIRKDSVTVHKNID